MKLSKIKVATMVAMLATTPLASVYAAAPAAPTPSPVTEAEAKSFIDEWFDIFQQDFDDLYDWLVVGPGAGESVDTSTPIGYLLYDNVTTALNTIAYFFSRIEGAVVGDTSSTFKRTVTGVSASTLEFGSQPREDGLPGVVLVGTEPVDLQLAPKPVPIDGGASLLLAAGAAYGLKRLRRKKGESPESEK